MPFRKTVRATTIDQFETALARADRIVVEGDDQLLAYAASRAAGAPEPAPTATGHEETRVLAPRERSGMPRAAKRSRPLPLGLAALAVVAAGAVTLLYRRPMASPPTGDARPPAVAPLPAPAKPGDAGAASPHAGTPGTPADATTNDAASPTPEAPPPPRDEPADTRAASVPLSVLVWPIVALVALVLMYLLARQAIAGGSNVKLEWKVTEKVSGRIVITKVRSA